MAAKKKSQLEYNAYTSNYSTIMLGTHTIHKQYAPMMQKVAMTT